MYHIRNVLLNPTKRGFKPGLFRNCDTSLPTNGDTGNSLILVTSRCSKVVVMQFVDRLNTNKLLWEGYHENKISSYS